MGSCARTAKDELGKKKQPWFRSAVLSRYGALDDNLAYCHITHTWYSKGDVKASHLVPKSLGKDETSFLFGTDEDIRTDSRNGLTLHHKVEGGGLIWARLSSYPFCR